MRRLMISFPFVFSFFLVFSGCGQVEEVDTSSAVDPGGKADNLFQIPVLDFSQRGSYSLDGTIYAGQSIRVSYNEDRLPNCRGMIEDTPQDKPNWMITMYMKFLPSGNIEERPLFRYQMTIGGPIWVKDMPQLQVPGGCEEVQVWFKNTTGDGSECTEWDSNNGANYSFQTKQPLPAPSITFDRFWNTTERGPFHRGGKVTVDYDPKRMELVTYNGDYMSYFASKYHCYGYGCCSHDYHNKLRVRFQDHGGFDTIELSGGPVELAIPGDAGRIEMYFDTEVFTQTWYCGGSLGPKSDVGPDYFYDSNYGRNFVFRVAD